ncbi:MAG: dihydrofolate reductase family protein [Candidatus Diapherotrites archaeon]|nr:dihydrofolate reductase family protein [Candidatus Diapherotrites archaeon]
MKPKTKVILYIAMSLDGFIARKNGSIDWLKPFENESEDYGYKTFYKKIGTVLVGNTTYRQALGFSSFPFAEKKCFVFTNSKQRPKHENVNFVKGNVNSFVKKLKHTEQKPIWLVGGAFTVNEFLKHNLVDEFIITVIPVFLGNGIPLFNGKQKQKKLKLIKVKKFKQGLVQLIYILL